ncbi:DUF1707 domain-containing protein [Kitasatospora aureofaciens]|uniref:DUF1707 SHOCT-like domain-containing protein n=1 Tax=Kitasatospora aureofaciens TaxID=1894 RepID=UPI001C475BA6|nr:DUF1707 domain-containing protein [Kitasatospora aureofaciens]MBV6696702.1 DUF1707 domain-containing protein [Kitasatospora aureofaciens]
MRTGSRRNWIPEAEREAVAAQLCEQFSQNRMTKAELETRLDDTFAAETREALLQVTADLPTAEPGEPTRWAARRADVARRVGGRHGIRALAYSIGLWACGGILFGAGWLGSGPARLLIVVGLVAILVGGRPRRGAAGRTGSRTRSRTR